ncbi:MAG: ABC transporter permease [Mycoplasmataceae bacterium]|nr:ABC transporter permease [Mycoplasmataceae bacterium]
MIISISCSIMAVVIFRDSKEDGSELIIMSKPIARWKIIVTKFICFGNMTLIMIAVSMLIMIGTLGFGKFNLASNPNGINMSELTEMLLGLLMGTLIVCLLFGAIAILLSVISGKIIIMVSTIGVAVIFNIIYMLVPILSITPNKYVINQYSIYLNSMNYVGIDGKMHTGVYANNVRFLTDDHDDDDQNWNTAYYVNRGNAHATGALVSYINVGQQLSSLFHSFTDYAKNDTNSAYGSDINEKYYLTSQKPIYENPTNNSYPWLRFVGVVKDQIKRVKWRIYGFPLNVLDTYNLAGATSEDFVYTIPSKNASILNLSNSQFWSINDITRYPNESKIREYVNSLEKDGYGYYNNGEVESVGTKSEHDLHVKFPKDLFENEESLIYYENPDFILPYKVQKDDHNYDNSMNLDYLEVWYLIMQDLQTALWNKINEAITEYQADPTSGLPPINQWTDKEPDSIYDRLMSPEETDQTMQLLSEINYAMSVWDFSTKMTGFTHSITFSTFKSDHVDNFEYANSNYLFNILNSAGNNNEINSSDVFSSIYPYDHYKYYNNSDLTIFWVSFALLFFALSIITYMRVDIK